MKHYRKLIISLVLAALFLTTACTASRQEAVTMPANPTLVSITQIDSFNPAIACQQALEVINNNPYSENLFNDAFARIVGLCESNKAPKNADVIWQEFVIPLKNSGKVPPDLARFTWNCYFSRQFASLPAYSPATSCCRRLGEIRKGLEKEYSFKEKGFAITQQGSPESHFLNAMYVYNTLWATCHVPE